ncbi:hypothetical protein BB560_001404 [Smittium megazygosporum]|uniref:Peroxin-3 n=1 Tax=Smittium megazygosporum TaxID=133381 RepID=A0A2T9ZHQ2_9FUNG|nr:hypothetical protein BB560_001404 [Smittium megazygosporum]
MSYLIPNVPNFVSRHKSKFLVLTGVAGGVYYSLSFLKSKLLDFQSSLQIDSWTRTNILDRFDVNLNLSRHTTFNLLSELQAKILSDINIEALFEELRTRSSKKDPPLSTNSDSSTSTQTFLRLLVSQYSAVILTILVHIQLSIIAQSTYIDSVSKKFALFTHFNSNNFPLPSSTFEGTDERNFLLQSWWILNKGWKLLKNIIVSSTCDIIESIDIKSKLTFSEFCDLIFKLNDSILSDEFSNQLLYICAPVTEAQYNEFLSANSLLPSSVSTEKYEFFVKQTMDILESRDVNHVFAATLSLANKTLLSSIESHFPQKSQVLEPPVEISSQDSPSVTSDTPANPQNQEISVNEFEKFLETSDPKISLVKLLPKLVNESKLILSDDEKSNNYIQEICNSEQIQALSASIFAAKPRN